MGGKVESAVLSAGKVTVKQAPEPGVDWTCIVPP